MAVVLITQFESFDQQALDFVVKIIQLRFGIESSVLPELVLQELLQQFKLVLVDRVNLNVDVGLLDGHFTDDAGKAVVLVYFFIGLRFGVLGDVVADVGWFFDQFALLLGFFLLDAFVEKDQLGLLRKLVPALDEGGEESAFGEFVPE